MEYVILYLLDKFILTRLLKNVTHIVKNVIYITDFNILSNVLFIFQK